MRKKGETTDVFVLEEVNQRPGSTIHEIGERLNWSNGRVDASVNRLASQGKVKVQHALRRGILVKKTYPSEHISKPRDVVEIPRNMIDYERWGETAEVYALSRSTIAISPRNVEEWEKRAFRRERVSTHRSEDGLEIKLPRPISDFYQLENSETSLSTRNDLALVTVESTLVPVSLPPTYPSEARYKLTASLMTWVYEGSSPPPSSLALDFHKGRGEVKNIPISSVPYSFEEVKDRLRKPKKFVSSSASGGAPVVIE